MERSTVTVSMITLPVTSTQTDRLSVSFEAELPVKVPNSLPRSQVHLWVSPAGRCQFRTTVYQEPWSRESYAHI